MLFSEMLNYKSIVFPLVGGNLGLTIMKKIYHSFPANQRGVIYSKPSSNYTLPNVILFINERRNLKSALPRNEKRQMFNDDFHLFIHGFEISQTTQAFDVCDKLNEVIASLTLFKNLRVYIAVDLGLFNSNAINNHLQYDLEIKKMLPRLNAECITYLYQPWFYGTEQEDLVYDVRGKNKTKIQQCWFCTKLGSNVFKEMIGCNVRTKRFYKMKKEVIYRFSDEIL